jgi:hypothetical protein
MIAKNLHRRNALPKQSMHACIGMHPRGRAHATRVEEKHAMRRNDRIVRIGHY